MKNDSRITDDFIIACGKECLALLAEKKAVDPLFLDLRAVNSYLDYFIIATGNSMIHCRALAREMVKFLTAKGIKERGRAPMDSGWIVLDFNELIIHVFTEENRAYYQLEKLWADAKNIG